MSKVRIVTDSAAHFFDPTFPAAHNVTVVPMRVQFGNQVFKDGVELSTEQFFIKCASGGPLPIVSAPPAKDFAAVYENLCPGSGNIVSIHSSGKLSRTPQNARAGADEVLGRCKIQVIDSLSTSVGLGALVQAAALAAEDGATLPEIVRIVRGMIPRLYSVFFVENMDYLAQAGRLSKAQATLGTMLGIKPFLTFDEGDIVPMEKVRHRVQAVEKLVEFVVEFSDIEQLGILQSSPLPTEDTRLLLEQLAVDFPSREWPVLVYGPSLGALLGPNAMGVIVLESAEALESVNAFHADYDD